MISFVLGIQFIFLILTFNSQFQTWQRVNLLEKKLNKKKTKPGAKK